MTDQEVGFDLGYRAGVEDATLCARMEIERLQRANQELADSLSKIRGAIDPAARLGMI